MPYIFCMPCSISVVISLSVIHILSICSSSGGIGLKHSEVLRCVCVVFFFLGGGWEGSADSEDIPTV